MSQDVGVKPMMDIQVRLMTACNLKAVNLARRTSDPYCVVKLIRTNEEHRSSVCVNTISPMWYQTMYFSGVTHADVLNVQIFDHNDVASDTRIGTLNIAVGDALSHAAAVVSEAAFTCRQQLLQPPMSNPSMLAPPHSIPHPSYPQHATVQPPPPPPYTPDFSSQFAPSLYPEPTGPPTSTYLPTNSFAASDLHLSPPHALPVTASLQSEPSAPPLSQDAPPSSSISMHSSSFTASAEIQRRMMMNYSISPQGRLMMILVPLFSVGDLHQACPAKPFKTFHVLKITEPIGNMGNSVRSSLGKVLRTGVEKAKPLQSAVNILKPIDPVFQEHKTWKITMHNVDYFFEGAREEWNTEYEAARRIFQGAQSVVTRRMVQMQHAYLYGGGANLKPLQNMRKHLQEETGNLLDGQDFFDVMEYGFRRGKPRLFTYVLMVNRLYFAETGAKFFRDIMSKHAMHCSASATVVYAGEMHVRQDHSAPHKPKMSLILDNNSGTYAPSKEKLPIVEKVFRYNFPGMEVRCFDYKDPLLKKYVSELVPTEPADHLTI